MAGNAVGSMTADAQLNVELSQLDSIDMRLSDEVLRGIVDQASQNVDRCVSIMSAENCFKDLFLKKLLVLNTLNCKLNYFSFT